LHVHTVMFILCSMSSVRKTVSLPVAIARRLDQEAKRRHTSVSALVTELVQQQPERLPYAGLVDDDEDLSQKIEEILSRLGR
jgi:Ribbon-helix-helix protein, copG family